MRYSKAAPPLSLRLGADLTDVFEKEPPSSEPASSIDLALDPLIPAHVFATDDEDAPPPPPSLPRAAARDPRESRDMQGSREPRESRDAKLARTRREERLPEPGTIIDKYRIEELLGIGGFAAVFRATHLMLDMPVALKLLRPRVLQRDPRLVDALCEEARYSAKIHHPNVVRIFDVTRTSELTYIVMEYIEGETLAQKIARSGALDEGVVVQIGIDVVDGLDAALQRGLIHRDIKPANIMVTRSGAAKIVDLSLARASVSDADTGKPTDSRRGILGTPMCIAPEQSRDPDRVDFRADIYSLGVTLYHAALGIPPFTSRDPAECVRMHREEPVPLPEHIKPGFPLPLQVVLLRMLAKDPGQRFPSYTALRAALIGALRR